MAILQAIQISKYPSGGITVVAIWSDGIETTNHYPYATKRTSKRDFKEWVIASRKMMEGRK